MGRKKHIKLKSKARTKYNPGQLKKQILSYLDENLHKAYSSKQIIKRLAIRDQPSKAAVQPLLQSLESDGKVEKIRHSYKSKRVPARISGRVDHVNARFAYVVTDTEHGDVWVKTDNLHFAMDGDIVEIAVSPKRHGKRREGKVLRVTKRGIDEIVGGIEFSTRYAFVIADMTDRSEANLTNEIRMTVRNIIGPIAKPDKVQIVPGLPKTRSGKIMRRILRKVAEGDPSNLGDISTLLDPDVVDKIIEGSKNIK